MAEISGMSPKFRSSRDLAMLQAFIDESGYPDGPVLVLAGWIASAETWADFAVEWQECLDMKPRIKRFKMSEAFQSWGDESQDRVTRFHRIIDDHALASVSIALPVEPYQKIFGHINVWKNPYVLLLFQISKGYRQHCDALNLGKDVKFIFDEQNAAAVKIAGAWEYFKQTGNEYLLEIMGGV